MILGCGGAGKSTFAKRLQQCLGIELFHLDRLYWRAGWQEATEAEWLASLEQVVQKDTWITDGNYTSSMPLRLGRADAIFYFDFPTRVCLWNAFKRVIKNKYLNARRDDMADGCPERFDLGFFIWIWGYNKRNRAKYYALFERLKDEKEIIVFTNYREVERFLEHCKAS